MRDNAVIIGNGRSRLNFDLQQLKERFVTYGCNALYRDNIPDVLFSMDIYMVNEILDNNIHYKCKFVTQHINEIDLRSIAEPIYFIKTYNSTPDSGNAAVEYAADNKHDNIYIIGFDYHNGQHNNVYSGTRNYNDNNHIVPIIQDEKWHSRLYNIVKRYNHIEFYHVTDSDQTISLPNMNYYTIEQYKEITC